MDVADLLQLAKGCWQPCTLHAGVKLDVFSALATLPQTVTELAVALQVDGRALDMLLHALVAMELLHKKDGRFIVTDFSRDYLVRQSANYLGYIILHHHYLVAGWSKLDQAVRYGAPVRGRASHEADGAERESFLLGMFNLATRLAPRIAAAVDLRDCRRLLDLGGGPGTYALYFCQHNPELRADVFDLPTTRLFAQTTIDRFGLGDRVCFVAGDAGVDPIGSEYDAVWISHLLHSEGPAICEAILTKAVAALKPGGQLLVQEFILDESRTAPLPAALFSLNMLIGTPEGQAYTESELSAMIRRAGGRAVRRLSLDLPEGAGIVAAQR